MISLDDISAYSKCPKYYTFGATSLSQQIQIAVRVIKKAYTTTLETEHLVDWRRILYWTDSLCYQGVNVSDKEAMAAAKMTTEYILKFLSAWYNSIYMVEQSVGFTDVTLLLNPELGQVADIIIPTSPPVITYIDDNKITDAKMFNDIKARGLAAIASIPLDSDEIIVRHLYMSPRGALDINEIRVHIADSVQVRGLLVDIANAITSKLIYPSVTEQCTNCPFNRRCRL